MTAAAGEKVWAALVAYAFDRGTLQEADALRGSYLAAIRQESQLPTIPPLEPLPPDVDIMVTDS